MNKDDITNLVCCCDRRMFKYHSSKSKYKCFKCLNCGLIIEYDEINHKWNILKEGKRNAIS